MKAWVFSFDGLWMGGRAVVLAETDEKARELLEERIRSDGDLSSVEEQVKSVELSHYVDTPQVAFYENGDY